MIFTFKFQLWYMVIKRNILIIFKLQYYNRFLKYFKTFQTKARQKSCTRSPSIGCGANLCSVSKIKVARSFSYSRLIRARPEALILTKLGGNHPGQVPQIKFEDKLEMSKVNVTEVKSGKSHFGPFDPFNVLRLKRNWV